MRLFTHKRTHLFPRERAPLAPLSFHGEGFPRPSLAISTKEKSINLVYTTSHISVNGQTHANTVQLYPCNTSPMIGLTTSLYKSIWLEFGLKTLSKVNVFVLDLSPVSFTLTWTSPFFGLLSTTLSEPAFFSAQLRGLQIRQQQFW